MLFGINKKEVEKISSLLGVKEGLIVADVGAGKGNYTIALAKLIGKNGKVIRAIRNVVKIPAIRENKKVNITLLENPA